MKHIIILRDGMADWPMKSLGSKTLLQYAETPYVDKLARMGRNDRLITVAEGFHPGNEVISMFVLGYNLPEVYEGRGPLETASIGVDLKPGGMATRCNLICVEGDILKNYSSGHISTEEADVLIQYLQEGLGNGRVRFHTGVQYRHLLVIKGGNKESDCTSPHDVPLKPFRPLMVKSLVPEAQETAGLISDLIPKSQELLKDHLLNLGRMVEGKDPAGSTWFWSPGYRLQMPTFSGIFPQVKKGTVISTVDLINGIGYYADLCRIVIEGVTGLHNTDYEDKVAVALEALKTDDFVYLHVEVSDEAGHEGGIDLKLPTIESLDKHAVGPIYETTKDWDEPVAIAVLFGHSTPCELRTRTFDPIPFLVWYPGIEPDEVQTYDEIVVCNGSYGLLREDGLIKEFMK